MQPSSQGTKGPSVRGHKSGVPEALFSRDLALPGHPHSDGLGTVTISECHAGDSRAPEPSWWPRMTPRTSEEPSLAGSLEAAAMRHVSILLMGTQMF